MPFFKIPFVPVGICFSKNESYVAIRRNSLRNAIEEKKCSNMQKKGMLAFLYFAPLWGYKNQKDNKNLLCDRPAVFLSSWFSWHRYQAWL